MKKYFSLTAAVCLALCLSTCARKPEEPEPDYPAIMAQAAQEGDVEKGRLAGELYIMSREEKGQEPPDFDFDQLYLLSRAIHCKYGHYRYSDELRMCAGEVILNRMDSPEYPDSMEAVLFQQGQCSELDMEEFESCLEPSRACVQTALRLLQGERMLEPEVVLETHYPAKGVYAVFCDDLLGNTYFYKSENLELYTGEAMP